MKRMAQRCGGGVVVVVELLVGALASLKGSSTPVSLSPGSTFSHLGCQCKVLLSDGLVVLQDPLQVGHCLVAVLCLNLMGEGKVIGSLLGSTIIRVLGGK